MKLAHHRSTIVLVAAAMILAGLLIWDSGSVSTSEADKRTENIIEAWRPDDVSQIDITIGDRQLRMQRERDAEGQLDWVLYEGDDKLDGDALEMTDLVSTLELAMFYRKVDDIDRAQLGLDDPRATFVVHMGELTYTVRIGGETAQPKGGAYVEVDGGSRGRVVYVVTKPTLEEFLIEPAELLTKRLATYLSPAVKRYEVRSDEQSYSLERGGWGGWTSGAFTLHRKGHEPVRADRFQLDVLLSSIGRIEAERFVPIEKDDPKNALTIDIIPREEGEPKVRLVVASESGAGSCTQAQAYAIRREPNPVAGCIAKGVLDELRVKPAQLVDRRVIGTAKSAIIELKLAGGGRVVDLARKGDGWHMRKPTEGPAAKRPMEELLGNMMKAEGEIVARPDLEALGLDDPRATVRVIGLPERTGGETAERVEKIAVGDAVEGVIHVRREDDGVVLALPVAVGELFLPQPTLLRSPQIFDEDRKYVRGVDIDCADRRQVISRGLDQAWAFETPKDAEVAVDGALATDIVDGMRGLEAVRWASEKPAKRHGLSEPWCRVSVKLVEPHEADPTGDKKVTRELSVRLGAETQGGYFAQVSGDEAVFVAPRALANAADTWLMSRASLIPDLEGVETVTLARGENELVVRKQGDSWRIAGRSDGAAIKIKNALEQLTAEAVVSRGAPREGSGFDEPLLTITLRYRDEPDQKVRYTIGKGDIWRNIAVFQVRRSDINATFLASKARLQPLLDAL